MAAIKHLPQKISTCLWFNDNAEQAVNFYTSVFKNSSIGSFTYYGENAPMPEGTILTIPFQLEGQEFLALNGGPAFTFNEAISFIVNCDTQNEIDEYWEKLLEGGKAQMCGWLKDQYGLSWQIVPTLLGEMLQSKDSKKVNSVFQCVMQMVKPDIEKLKNAFITPS